MHGQKELKLEKRVALVSGGGRGIGRAIAQALAGAGARVVVVARSEEELAVTKDSIQQQDLLVLRIHKDGVWA